MNAFKQQGAVLVVSLIFLAMLTLVGVSSMQSTSLDYQISANAALKDRSFYSSESGRLAMGDILDDHIFERGWTNFSLPAGLSMTTANKDLYLTNDAGDDLANQASLTIDARYQIDNAVDGDFSDGGDIDADVVVYKTQTKWATGAGVAMVSGYQGLGKSSAAGGTHMFFELRSTGKTALNAQSVTATEYRAIVKN